MGGRPQMRQGGGDPNGDGEETPKETGRRPRWGP